MASLVGFMFLNRQNIVADRDVQTPMGQMEYTHGHQSQSVVRGGQVVFQGELAVEPAQIPLAGYFPTSRQITSCRYPTSKAGPNDGRHPGICGSRV